MKSKIAEIDKPCPWYTWSTLTKIVEVC